MTTTTAGCNQCQVKAFDTDAELDLPEKVIKESYDMVRTWEEDGFRLDLYDTYQTNGHKSVLAYQFFHNGKLIFQGDRYSPSPMWAIDSDQAVGGLLSFLSLKPGDTDDEYFEGYTPDQLAWARKNGEYLGLLADELENGRDD